MITWPQGPRASRARFDDLLVHALPDLWRFALRLEREPARAEDLLHDAAATAMDRAEGLQDLGAFRTWMFRVVFRTFQQGRDRTSARCEQADDNVIHLATAASTPERSAAEAALGRRLQLSLDALPTAQREAVLLVDAEGMSFSEVAHLMDVPPGTVASRVARGRHALRTDLHDVALAHGVIR